MKYKNLKFSTFISAVFLAVFLLSGCSENAQYENFVKTEEKQETPEKQPIIEEKETIEYEDIDFKIISQNDLTLKKGQTKIKQEGVNGKKELKYKVFYTDGVEIERKLASESITTKPVDKIVLNGTKEKKKTKDDEDDNDKNKKDDKEEYEKPEACFIIESDYLYENNTYYNYAKMILNAKCSENSEKYRWYFDDRGIATGETIEKVLDAGKKLNREHEIKLIVTGKDGTEDSFSKIIKFTTQKE